MIVRKIFQSTRPSRAATSWLTLLYVILMISIHAALTGRDPDNEVPEEYLGHFNPRGPHGPRRYRCGTLLPNRANFNPRGPHGPRPKELKRISTYRHFNPRGPHGPRRQAVVELAKLLAISIHAALTGRDARRRRRPGGVLRISIHAALTGRDSKNAQILRVFLLKNRDPLCKKPL